MSSSWTKRVSSYVKSKAWNQHPLSLILFDNLEVPNFSRLAYAIYHLHDVQRGITTRTG